VLEKKCEFCISRFTGCVLCRYTSCDESISPPKKFNRISYITTALRRYFYTVNEKERRSTKTNINMEAIRMSETSTLKPESVCYHHPGTESTLALNRRETMKYSVTHFYRETYPAGSCT